MRSIRLVRGWVVAAALGLAAVSCQTPPTSQPVPPGGTVVATSPPDTYVEIEAASSDLSRIVYEQGPYVEFFLLHTGGSFNLYDEDLGTVTELPFARRTPQTAVGMSADGETIVFSSPDPDLQSGEVSKNCVDYNGYWEPLSPTWCAELYLYDPDTGTTLQLTGLGASSTQNNSHPVVSEDGRFVEFKISPLIPESGSDHARMDLVTGEVVDIPAHCCDLEWDRGDTVVRWDLLRQRLTSTEVATGDVTVLPIPSSPVYESSAGNGRYVVFSGVGGNHLVDTTLGTIRAVPGEWVDAEGERYVLTQNKVAPSGGGRVIIAPLDP